MYTNHFRSPAFRIDSESRLCRFGEKSPEHAHETLASFETMHKNEDLIRARAQFDNKDTRAEYPEIGGDNVLDRAYFQALLLDSAITADDKGYEDLKREDLNVADPFRLAELPSDLDRGRWLVANMPLDLLRSMDEQLKDVTDKKDITDAEQLERLGQEYMDRVTRADLRWEKKGEFADPVLRRIPLERYRSIRLEVDAVLEKNGVRVPHTESDLSTMGDTNLTRREYLTLITLVWKGAVRVDEVKAAAASGIGAVRGVITDKSAVAEGAQKRFVDLSLEELGPNETLSGLNIVITPDMRRAYVRAATGRDPDYGVPVQTADGLAVLPEQVITLAPDQTAATWERYPERALPFLSAYMGAPGSGNEDFLKSLEYHFVLSPAEREGMAPPPLDERDTRATLRLVSQSLIESEKVMQDTARQKMDLRNALSTAEKVEKTFGNVWEYMKDVRSHPIGSALMWGTAIGAGVMLWKFAKSEHRNFTKWLLGAGVVGAAVGLYQQNTTGRAWWEALGDKMDDWMGREKSKEPGERTLPNYWTERLDRTTDRERAILSVLGDQELGPVIDWYGQMREWEKRGGEGTAPVPPFRIDGKMRRYFGANTPSKERNKMMYDTLTAFFEDRGRAVKKEIQHYPTDMPIEDDAALGYAYVKDRYLEQTFFQSAMRGTVVIGNITINGRTIVEWDPENPELKRIREQSPTIFAELQMIRQDYVQEMRRRPSENWDMNTIFFLEANPEVLRRMGREGTEAATVLDRLASGVKSMVDTVTVAGPEERAKKLKLFSGAEAALFDSLGGTYLLPERAPARTADEIVASWDAYVDSLAIPEAARSAMKEAIRAASRVLDVTALQARVDRAAFEYRVVAEWNEFTSRLPADAATVARLREYMAAYVAANADMATLNLFNDIETKKYQLLIAASGTNNRLKLEDMERLNPEEDATWNAMLDSAIDWVAPDRAVYPRVDRFYGLRSLFDSEAEQQGGVVWYDVMRRIFPAWEKSNFEVLDAQIKRYEGAFARLRALPVIRPGLVLTEEQINGLEKQLAQRMANRTLEAMLLTHGQTVPDAAGDRTVSVVEQQNLGNYYDDLFLDVLGCPAGAIHPNVELPSTLEQINNYVWNQLPNDVIRVTNSVTGAVKEYIWDPVKNYWVEIGGPWIRDTLMPALARFPGATIAVVARAGRYFVEVTDRAGRKLGEFAWESYDHARKEIYRLHGVLPERFDDFSSRERAIQEYLYNGKNAGLKVSIIGTDKVAIGPFVDLNPFDIDHPLIEVSVGEFLTKDASQLINEWVAKTTAEKRQAILNSRPPTLSNFDLTATGSEAIEFGTPLDPKSQTSIYDLAKYSEADIFDRYTRWVNARKNGDARALATPDALAY